MEDFDQVGQRYKTLLGFGKFFSFMGWALVGVGALVFLLGFLGVGGSRSSFGGNQILAIGFLSGLPLALSGLMMVAGGQGISCFVSIEHNTHVTMLAQQAALSFLRGQTPMPGPSTNTSLPTNPKVESMPLTTEAPREVAFHCIECDADLTEQEAHRFRGEVYCAKHYEKAMG